MAGIDSAESNTPGVARRAGGHFASLGSTALDTARRGPKLALVVLLVFGVIGLFGEWIAPQDPSVQQLDERLVGPAWAEGGSSSHILGTDSLGRDVLSRLIIGARVSLLIGLTTVLVAGVFGTAIGVLAGYFGGATDYVLMRFTDAMIAMPFLVVALAAAVVFNPSITLLITLLVLFGWANYSRVVRSVVLQLRDADFVTLARLAGCSTPRILLRHVVPNILNTFVVLATLQLAIVIVAEASLSFLGVGVPRPTPAWGSMLSDGREFVNTAWWITVFPGLAITSVVLSVNIVGDWLRVRLDPRFRDL